MSSAATSALSRNPFRRAAERFAPKVPVLPWWCDRPDCDGKPHDGWPAKHARVTQRPPPGDWLVHLILAGRGFGKTRSGAEWAKQQAQTIPGLRGALIAVTWADGRDTMVEGESGLLAVLAPSALRGGSATTA